MMSKIKVEVSVISQAKGRGKASIHGAGNDRYHEILGLA